MKHFLSILITIVILSLSKDLIASPAFAATSLANQFTVSLWVNPITSVVTKALAVNNNEIRLVTDNNGYVNCQIYTDSWQTGAVGTVALPLSTWSHVTCTYDKVTLRIFVNGIAQGTTPAQTGTVNDSAAVWKIGQDAGATYGDLAGTIDEVKIYNYARTQKQIVSDMNAGHPAVGSPVGSAVAHYKFDEGYGATVNNAGNGGSVLNGAMGVGNSAPTWTNNGKFGKALSFDGNDYVYKTDGTNSPLDVTNITVSAWINPSTIDANEHPIIEKGYSSAWEFSIDNNSGGLKVNAYHGGAYEGDMLTTASGLISANQWQHVVWTYNGAVTKIYLNGKVVASSNKTGDLGTNSSTFYIGARGGTWGHFLGLIDEVKIYNYALTADEVKIDYNQGKAIVMGSLSSGTGNTNPSTAASQEYCVPGDATTCLPPVARWDFNEGIGTTAFDTSGNGNNGGLGVGSSAPTWTTGKVGKGLKFDGNNYIDVGQPSSLNVTKITVEAWVKYPLGWTSPLTIIGRDDSTNRNWSFYQNSANLLRFFVFIGNTSKIKDYTFTPVANIWYHLVGVYDGSNVRIYVNGADVGTPTAATGDMDTDVVNITIGKDLTGAAHGSWNGLIDQVRIYNYARTPAQVAWDYNRGAPVAQWKFDECQGAVANDSSGNGNNGTITIGASGSQNTVGTCNLGVGSSSPWGNGAGGKYNASLNFDGTDDYVNAGNLSSVNPGTSDFSVSAWINPNGSQSNLGSIVDKYSGPGYFISLNGYTPRVFLNDIGGGAYIWQNCGTTPVANGQWSLLTVVFNRTSNAVCYINGVQTGTVAISTRQQSIYTARNLYIGRESVDNGWFKGQIDDVQIYNYALTPAQIKTLYNQNSSIRFGPATGTP